MIYLTLWPHCVWSTGWGIWSCSGTPPIWYQHPVQRKRIIRNKALFITSTWIWVELLVDWCHQLTLGLIPSTPSGTFGKASYSVETYVMTDFSSGDWTSTSDEGSQNQKVTNATHVNELWTYSPSQNLQASLHKMYSTKGVKMFLRVFPKLKQTWQWVWISPSGSSSLATPSCSATQNACSKFDRLACVDTRLMSTRSGLQ